MADTFGGLQSRIAYSAISEHPRMIVAKEIDVRVATASPPESSFRCHVDGLTSDVGMFIAGAEPPDHGDRR